MRSEELKETAALAHLNLDEDELSALLPAFEQMLEYFAAMQAAEEDRAAFPEGFDSSDSALTDNSRTVSSGFFRPDSAASEKLSSPLNNEKLLNNAGERDGRFLVIPNIRRMNGV